MGEEHEWTERIEAHVRGWLEALQDKLADAQDEYAAAQGAGDEEDEESWDNEIDDLNCRIHNLEAMIDECDVADYLEECERCGATPELEEAG